MSSSATVDGRNMKATYQVLHSERAGLVDAFEVFEDIVSIAVDDSNAEVRVVLMLYQCQRV